LPSGLAPEPERRLASGPRIFESTLDGAESFGEREGTEIDGSSRTGAGGDVFTDVVVVVAADADAVVDGVAVVAAAFALSLAFSISR